METVLFKILVSAPDARKAFYAARKPLRDELGKVNTGTLADKELFEVFDLSARKYAGYASDIDGLIAALGAANHKALDVDSQACGCVGLNDGSFMFFGHAHKASPEEKAIQEAAAEPIVEAASEDELVKEMEEAAGDVEEQYQEALGELAAKVAAKPKGKGKKSKKKAAGATA